MSRDAVGILSEPKDFKLHRGKSGIDSFGEALWDPSACVRRPQDDNGGAYSFIVVENPAY